MIIIGMFIPIVITPDVLFRQTVGWYLSALLLFPCLIDGFAQNIFGIESTNIRRAVTGILLGLGINVLCISLFGFSITWR